MTVMGIEVITGSDPQAFKEIVNKFLDENENLIIHEKTVFSITQEMETTRYSVIFYGEI